VVNTSDTINLSGTNANFLGGAELDLVSICQHRRDRGEIE
jgi:hypothetical protein